MLKPYLVTSFCSKKTAVGWDGGPWAFAIPVKAIVEVGDLFEVFMLILHKKLTEPLLNVPEVNLPIWTLLPSSPSAILTTSWIILHKNQNLVNASVLHNGV